MNTTTTNEGPSTAILKAYAKACAAHTASTRAAQITKSALEATLIYRDSATPAELLAYYRAQAAYEVACDARDTAFRVAGETKRAYDAACEARDALELVTHPESY